VGTYTKQYNRLISNSVVLENAIASASHISHGDILKDMFFHTQNFTTWAYYAALAEANMLDAKRYLDKIFAVSKENSREELIKSGDKKPTVDRINNLAIQTTAYEEALNNYLWNNKLYLIFKKVENGLLQRTKMLQSLNSRQRQELASIPRDSEESVFAELEREETEQKEAFLEGMKELEQKLIEKEEEIKQKEIKSLPKLVLDFTEEELVENYIKIREKNLKGV